jgi:chromosome transmission fidelity protein 4
LDLLRDTAAGNEESDAAYEVNKLEVSQDKELLKLVQAACKADKLQRALDIVRIMNNPKTIEAAGKVAAFYHLPGLQEKIGIIREATEDKKRRKERAGRNESYRMVARETPVPSYASPVPSRAALAAAKVTEFAPRSLGSKRASRAQVASTTYEDLSPSISRYVSETPEPMNGLPSRREEDDLLASPESKRRRLDNQTEDDGFRKPYPPTESMQSDTIKKPSGKRCLLSDMGTILTNCFAVQASKIHLHAKYPLPTRLPKPT